MHARSALFDLYGDHLRERGGTAPVAALVRLLHPLGIRAPAVRTAVSRMVRQGWLRPVELAGGAGYALEPRAVVRLDEAAARIYRREDPGWDGCWHVVVVPRVAERTARERLRAGLAFLGYGLLGEGVWVAPRPSAELTDLLAGEGVPAERFCSRHEGDEAALVRAAWDLDVLSDAYTAWLREAEAIVAGAGPRPDDETAFGVRSRLVHEWRKFLFTDPGLPASLLPATWPGPRARELFTTEAERLLPAATRFVDAQLARG